MDKDEQYRTDSYRVAVTPTFPEDGRPLDGRPKSRRRRTPSKSSRSTIDDDFEDMRSFQIEMDEHKISVDALYARYATDPNMGLTSMRVEEIYSVFGPNVLTPVPRLPEWVIFCKNLFGGFSIILWVACFLCLVTFSVQSDLMEHPPYENLTLGILLFIVILLTSGFSFYQEVQGIRMMDELRRPLQQYVNVVREGRKLVLPSEQLVMGDVVDLKAGDRIPADVRIISSSNFKVDNSCLTGVTEPQLRSAEFTNEDPLETMNMAYVSANAIEGHCRGVVVATGHRTLVGRLHTTVEFHYPESAIVKEVACTMHTLTNFGIVLGLLLFVIAYIVGYHWIDALIFLIGILLAVVPEGLLAVVNISLLLTAKRMYAKNCLVKHLDCIETLGRVSSIVVDKNGSLTTGPTTLCHMWLDGKMVDIDLSDNQNAGGSSYNRTAAFQVLARVAGLCNAAQFAGGQEAAPILKRQTTGNRVDAALLKFVQLSGTDVDAMRTRNRRVCEIPFSPMSRFQVTIHETEDKNDPSYVLLMKGAPELLLECCSTIVYGGKEIPLDDTMKETFSDAFIDMGSMGETVIGFCDYKLPTQKFPPGYPFDAEEQNFPLTGLRFLGLVSLREPIRPNVPDAVTKCRSAGIRIVMVTGDHPITAKAIARECRIFTEQSRTVEDLAAERQVAVEQVMSSDANALILHGSDLKDLTRDRMDYLLRTHTDVIFARLTLSQKLQVVEVLQHAGGVVAATGSGVCDAPALRKAHIGIAKGATADSVAKEAADVVLLDDNFATIVAGIEEGRLIFENLRKAIGYIITTNMPEVWPFFMFLVLGIPLPLGALTILIIDLGTDMLPAIALSFEKPEYDIMSVNPRNPRDTRLIDINMIDVRNGQIGMIEMVAGFFAYCVVMGENGFWMEDLFYRRRAWDSMGINDFTDSYGQEWTYERRKHLEWTCHSAFFISIVICQWVNSFCCKTRTKSIRQQGFTNHALTSALIAETVLALILLYTPGMTLGFRMMPIKFNWWLPALPFAFLIVIYDEVRRIVKVRNYKGSRY